MNDAIHSFLNTKILLLLLATSLSGNAFLAYKLTLISDQLGMLQGDQQLVREKTERAIKNARSTNLVPNKAVTSW